MSDLLDLRLLLDLESEKVWRNSNVMVSKQGGPMEKLADEKRYENSKGLDDLGYEQSNMRVSTERYTSREFQTRERDEIWMKVWQVAGRDDDISAAGDWKEYRIFDQSYLIVRGRDGKIRGFVNACRHRGNPLCKGGKGHATTIVCPFHRWSYSLEGELRGVARPDLVGPIDKGQLGLVEVSVDTWAGFIFLNPDPDAKPLAEYLGEEVIEYLAPYHLEEMIPVDMNVREDLECNWKVVIDAFQEGYHIQGVHPQMGDVISVDPAEERFNFIGDHHLVVAPFTVITEGFTPEQAVEGLRTKLPAIFHGESEVVPNFEKVVESYYNEHGKLELPECVTVHSLLEKTARETLTRKGLDVSGLADAQMTNHSGWFLFPNFFLSIRAGDGILIAPVPHPSGDPNRCTWQVTRLAWLPPEQREARREEVLEVKERGTYPYFEVLQQDYEQGAEVQRGLRNTGLKYMTLVQEEAAVAKFHGVVDKYVDGRA